VALKVLKTRRAESEQYARFRREIELLRRHGDDAGVLPIIDANLPAKPAKNDRAWIAMPIAKPMREALLEAPFETTVSAIAAVAATLARLADSGVAHRDLKPGNLYWYDGRWVVGDFGLVHFPNVEDAGLTGNRLGPFGFMPDEMFNAASAANPYAVDVFQLAKCLLVLAAGIDFPPQGHVAAGSSGALSRYVAAARVSELDQVIDRSTRRDPSGRPNMAELAHELGVWLAYTPPAGEPDVSALTTQFRQTHHEALESQSQREAWKERFEETFSEAEGSLVEWVTATLDDVGIRTEVLSWHEHYQWVERTRFMGMQPEFVAEQVWVTGEFGNPDWPTKIAVAIGFDLDIKGEFWCKGYVAWGDLESTAGHQLDIEERVAPIESLEVGKIVADLKTDMRNACVQMLNQLAQTSS
jgi:serine/threonine protein kinase